MPKRDKASNDGDQYKLCKKVYKHNNKVNHYNNKSDQHFTVESVQKVYEEFNYGYLVDGVTCNELDAPANVRSDSSALGSGSNKCYNNLSGAYRTIIEHSYENLPYAFELNLSKNLLFHKFFHGDTENNAEYVNLCRGCGYGVFEARGDLCNFCTCVVNGVNSVNSVNSIEPIDDCRSNIYENICDKCSALYSSDECICCVKECAENQIYQIKNCKQITDIDSQDEKVIQKIPTKLTKSKSFGKRERRSIFHTWIDTLRRGGGSQKSLKNSESDLRKPLEIVHNVDGFQSVFHTKDTFDLQRICELKRNKATSSSDQHIYGRLKRPEIPEICSRTLPSQLTQSQSHNQLLEVLTSFDDLTKGGSGNENIETDTTKAASEDFSSQKSAGKKRPRISRPRLLRLKSRERVNNSNPTPEKRSLYLDESICQWMRSLRCEIHNYRSCGYTIDDFDVLLCDPKSIPAKTPLIYNGNFCSTKQLSKAQGKQQSVTPVSNCQNIDKSRVKSSSYSNNYNRNCCLQKKVSYEDCSDSDKCSECDGIVTLRRFSNHSVECDVDDETRDLEIREQKQLEKQLDALDKQYQRETSPVAQMVNDFKRNLIVKKMQQQKHTQLISRFKNEESHLKQQSQMSKQENMQQQRSKRQAIYLKIDDGDTTVANKNNNSTNNNNNSPNIINNSSYSSPNNNNSNKNTFNVNYSHKQQATNESLANEVIGNAKFTQTQFNDRVFLTSSTDTREANTTLLPSSHSSKRCGIHERDSDFVNDILSAFETFLQRDSSDFRKETIQEVSFENANRQQNIEKCISASTVAKESNSVLECNEPLVFENAAICGVNVAVIAPSALSTFASVSSDITAISTTEQIFDFIKLINNLRLSSVGLHSAVIFYEPSLRAFLHAIRERMPYRVKFAHLSTNNQKKSDRDREDRLVRKFCRFHAYCQQKQSERVNRDKNASGKCVNFVRLINEGIAFDSENVYESVANVLRKAKNGSDEGASEHASAATERNSVKIVVKLVESCEAVGNVMFSMSKEDQSVKSQAQVNSAEEEIYAKVNKAQRNPENILNKLQVPVRDPTTVITTENLSVPPQRPAKPESLETTPIKPIKSPLKMTAPSMEANNNNKQITNNNTNEKKHHNNDDDDEDIYQPIWKFKTVGEAQERYNTDADFYETSSIKTINEHTNNRDDDDESCQLMPAKDEGEWETDDEFMFTTAKPQDVSAIASTAAVAADTCSSYSVELEESGSITGSTVTGFDSISSTVTLASAISSLTHHLFRNIGIFYSLTEPKLRAIIYDYDRVHASAYFAKQVNQQKQQQTQEVTEYREEKIIAAINDDAIGKSSSSSTSAAVAVTPPPPPPPYRTSSIGIKTPTSHIINKTVTSTTGESSLRATRPAPPPPPLKTKTTVTTAATTPLTSISPSAPVKAPKLLSIPPAPPKLQLLPDSVQAWKFMLLDVNYQEDEEDMIVSETEILRTQEIREDIDTRQTQQLSILQRFKSASIGNLIDLPSEDDKKSIAERMRNKLQRGVFKLRSPKSEKKARGLFRRAEATSLYLEDGIKPKYPIFGAPLEQLELNRTSYPNVPRFVVDCVDYIEREGIRQDGLYRASGNKVSIDELKEKLSQSYIYDPKLLITDDIHTLTSLLKQFFRELGSPLIPQETYERLGSPHSDPESLTRMRLAFEEMCEPNRSTLAFLIRHLTHVAASSSENRMPASNLAIVWGPCILSANQMDFNIGRMNTLAKVLIENYHRIFSCTNERLVS